MKQYTSSTRPRSTQRLLLIITLWLIAGTACSLPGIWQPTEEPGLATPSPRASLPAQTQPVQPTPKLTMEPLPPALVEATPLPSSELGPRQPIIFYFNQAMEKASVESALQVQPRVAGSFKWLNEYAVSFTPDQPLPLDTDLSVVISSKARAANGLPLAQEVALTYRTSSGLKEVDLLPRPNTTGVDPASAIVATFNRPVVALGADPGNLVPAFNVEPEAKGRGEWLNTSTYIFYPEPPLLGGKEYTVRFKTDLAAADGSEWASDHLASWKFKTELPKVTSISPEGKKAIFLDDKFTLNFNQAMDRSSVEQGFALKAGSEQVTGKFTWNEALTQVAFKADQLFKRSSSYTLTLAGNVRSLGGATPGQPFSMNYTTVAPLSISETELSSGIPLKTYDVRGTVRLKMTAPLAKQDLNKLVTITPSIGDVSTNESVNQDLFISGSFKPSTRYQMTISADLMDRWGGKMGKPFILAFSTAPAESSLSLSVPQPYSALVFITPSETNLPAAATNITTVRISQGKLTPDEFAAMKALSTYDRDIIAPRELSSWEKKLTVPTNQSATVNLPLTASGGSLPPGLYYYTVTSPELNTKYQRTMSALVVSSRVHLLIKVGSNQVMVWAVNLETLQPVPGANIEFFRSSKGKLTSLGMAPTNNQGLAQIEVDARQDTYDSIVAMLGKPGEVNFGMVYSDWSEWVEGYTFGIPTNYFDDGADLYFYTDRPIYRPGQTVYYRGMVNQKTNGRYSQSDNTNISVKVLAPFPEGGGEQPVLARETLLISAYGTITGSFELPASAPPGFYQIQVEKPRFHVLQFQVADYRKPEVEVNAAFVKPEYAQGEEIKAQVKAQYYFGAPAGNLNIRWTLTARSQYFAPLAGYQIGDWDTDWMLPFRYTWYLPEYGLDGTYITGGEGRTGADGTLSITIPAGILQDNAGSIDQQELVLEASVADVSEFKVSNRTSATLHPADFYIGIKPESWNGQAKKPLGYSIQLVDWNGKPTGPRRLTATFQKVNWKEREGWQPETGPYFEALYTQVASTDFSTDAQGQARLEFTPPDAGTYQLEIRGDGATSRSLMWVGGEGRAPWPRLPDQHLSLQLDAEEYAAGQSAKIFIPNPIGEGVRALITVERSRVMKTEVVTINGNNYTYTLPVTADLAPNAFITVTLLGETDGLPDYRHGIIQINVKPDALKLQVQVVVEPQRAQPGGEVRLKVNVKDDQGKPVKGEFSAALVDKAVLALADPNALEIFKAFYGTQPLAVQTSLDLSIYSRRLVKQISAPGRGGGGGDLLETPPLRTEFEDTAYWNGSFETDVNGNAVLSIKLPDNLTTWVITVRGLSLDRKVGEGTQELVTSKDLLLRPVTPRFLVAGDRVELAAMVHNNTSASIPAEVTLQVNGVELENPTTATQKIELPANDRRRVTWWVKVNNAKAADLRFSVKGSGLQDASKPTWGDLPILDYSAPQTFATSGVMAEAGERLEVVSLPRSFIPSGGELSVELAPSLAAVILDGLKAIKAYPYDFTEAILSHLYPNLRTYQVLSRLGIDSPELKTRLDKEIIDGLERLRALQNQDGGWGWSSRQSSSPYLSAYALLVLSEAQAAKYFVDSRQIEKTQAYLINTLPSPSVLYSVGVLERLSFQQYALMVSGKPQADAAKLYDFREKLSPWARAMLALTMVALKPGDERVRNLVSDLESKTVRSATGAFWDPAEIDSERLTTPNFSTAVVVLALARLDPAAAVLTDAVRYLVSHRQACGCWTSSYEASWVLAALGEVLQGTGDLNANFNFSAALNGTSLATGKAGGAQTLNAIQAVVPISNLNPLAPNALTFTHGIGNGRLYYRAILQVNRPVETAQPLQAGISLTRRYYVAGQDCRKNKCEAIDRIKLSANQTVMVRLTVTVPRAMYFVVLEDTIPAGFEIVDFKLKTTQRYNAPGETPSPDLNVQNPFSEGWNWWTFGEPRIYDQRIRWMGEYVPVGTYEVTYRLTPLQVGEYRAIPARAYQNYFPEVQGTSAGTVFTILP